MTPAYVTIIKSTGLLHEGNFFTRAAQRRQSLADRSPLLTTTIRPRGQQQQYVMVSLISFWALVSLTTFGLLVNQISLDVNRVWLNTIPNEVTLPQSFNLTQVRLTVPFNGNFATEECRQELTNEIKTKTFRKLWIPMQHKRKLRHITRKSTIQILNSFYLFINVCLIFTSNFAGRTIILCWYVMCNSFQLAIS